MSATVSPLLQLPVELILLITPYLPNRSLSKLARTCHALHNLLTPLLDRKLKRKENEVRQWAIRRNWPVVVSYTLKLPRARRVRNGHWLFYLAASDGFEEIIRVLLEHGVSPGPNHEKVYSPLRAAKDSGHMGVVKMLLESKGYWKRWRRDKTPKQWVIRIDGFVSDLGDIGKGWVAAAGRSMR